MPQLRSALAWLTTLASAGLLGGKAAPEILFDSQIQMGLDFGIELTIHLFGSGNRLQTTKRS